MNTINNYPSGTIVIVYDPYRDKDAPAYVLGHRGTDHILIQITTVQNTQLNDIEITDQDLVFGQLLTSPSYIKNGSIWTCPISDINYSVAAVTPTKYVQIRQETVKCLF